LERIGAIAKIHQERLAALKGHPVVGDVRSIGSVAAIELRADDAGYFSKIRPKLYKFFLDAGILLRPLGNVVYILPPYVISSGDLHYIYDHIAKSLDLLTQGA
jgi:adenosylmethionine-8-amino-7-oxononanoate aminotransferase